MSKRSSKMMDSTFGFPFPSSTDFARHAYKILGEERAKNLKTLENVSLDQVPKWLKTQQNDQDFSVRIPYKEESNLSLGYTTAHSRKTVYIDIFEYQNDLISDQEKYDIISWGFDHPTFLSACVHDTDYSSYQNTVQIGSYEQCGEIEPDYPIISHGAIQNVPYNQIYDTSLNSGYLEYHTNYKEEIGATMWLGQEFWQRSGADREDVKAADWLQTEEMEHGILKVVAWEHPFNSDKEPQRSIQFNLRRLLFPKAVIEREQEEVKRKKIAVDLLQDYFENGSPPVAPDKATIEEQLSAFLPDESYKEALKSADFRKPDGTPDFAAIVEKGYRIKRKK